MKILLITNRKGIITKVLVDDLDYPELSQYKWHITKGYACRNDPVSKKTLYMHRQIIGFSTIGLIDHRNRIRTDNQRSNLRIADYSENGKNRSSHSDSTSKYMGVSFYRSKRSNYQRWRAAIKYNNKVTHIGYFKQEDDAAKAYDAKAKEFHGPYANLNFNTIS